ncbi:histidine phosphatase family protein [Rhodococcoides kyotonense]|uniref:Broad specificity phosphatase PhoE n=1 Tax=Rhodococcoides kyotonense TaxID=398843 RepID=A0A239LBM3_9NOCA|nr:histidine phosphatase family protein [Rhodococcus kyotonensis]SNT27029.1 Broad specificity phosphatase PhoE [Rhodococcus kyotonensis]
MAATVTRLSLISHGMTEAMRRARFPSDEPLDSGGSRQLDDVTFDAPTDSVLVAPELRTRQTADALGLRGDVVVDLSDLAYGDWAGSSLEDLSESDMVGLLTDTSTTPPGGESIDALFIRVGAWMDRVADEHRRILAVTHPAIVRAVVVRTLDAPIASFWRVDIPPVTSTSVNFRGGRWTLRSVAERIT